MEVLTLGSLGKLAGTGVTFRDVDERISSALDVVGYDDKSYFGVPGGFAIVTRLEKMDAYGYPDYRYRWAPALAPISFTDFSLTNYLAALFGAPKGQYRVFVFVVSSEPVVQSGTPVAQREAQTWIVEGANKLPSQMKDLPYTREHTTTAYIYEFVQSGVGGDVSFNIPSDFTGRTHLKRAGLWENLNANCSGNSGTIEICPTPVAISLDALGIPAGWMSGGYNPSNYIDVHAGNHDECRTSANCLRITYRVGGSWGGILWWPLNCGTTSDQFAWKKAQTGICGINVLDSGNLMVIDRLTFWARGDKGGEVIEFKVGAGTIPPSPGRGLGRVTLKSEWEQYQIPLDGMDLTNAIALFTWVASDRDNSNGAVFYLSEIQFEGVK
ncbi:MAG: hypothetical protein ABI904_05170 [Chloroflexota bacterium]